MSDTWHFDYPQSAAFYDRGEQVLVFRHSERNRAGERGVALRSTPFDMALPGPLGASRGTCHGWKDHKATKAAAAAYGLPELSGGEL